ncbi:MAG: TetR/AcrR family transcriptional regulator [Clostridia bacterium]|nr:TetR/AcrR family transcriptional regulator [Clostridia bacterium]
MGSCQRKEKEKSIRTEDILNAAEKVFFSKGVENSTMDDIAKEAEYSKRTLYAYFESKEQLYNAIILRAFNVLKVICDGELNKSSAMSGLEKTILIVRTFMAFMDKYPNYFKAISQYESWKIELTETDRIKAACHSEEGNSFNTVIRLVNEGIRDGSIRDDIDAVSTAYILYANVLGVGNIIMNKGKHICRNYDKQTTEVIEEMFRFIERSLRK